MTTDQSFFQSWHCGANFIPSSAINQLEFWQAATFDPVIIERELGYAATLGMDAMRVYLHDLAFEQDPAGFLERMERYLAIADRLHIRTMFVFFDDCWNPDFAIGPQPAPKPRTHNSGWIQSPGFRAADDPAQRPRLKNYVQSVMRHFAGDSRIFAWDLYNEPGNGSCGDDQGRIGCRGLRSLPLLNDVFDWALAVENHQPVTSGVWTWGGDFDELNDVVLRRSEIVSFHSYQPPAGLQERLFVMKHFAKARPVICTEFMARGKGSTFAGSFPLFRTFGVSALCWGLVAGKTNTIYPWGSTEASGEPEAWFHDVFNPDGTMLYESERAAFCFHDPK